MLKKAIVIVFLICVSCNLRAEDFVVFKKGSFIPEVVFTDNRLKPLADSFCIQFEAATGIKLHPVQKATAGAKSIIQLNLATSVEGGYFEFRQEDNTIDIVAQDITGMEQGIRYFFTHYMSKDSTQITIPMGLEYNHMYAFEYREPYFPDNFKAQFRKDNATQTLEETWGLWGHNIGKAITVSPKMLAQVNGKVSEEQFCFSSPELYDALKGFIKKQIADSPGRTKFMVMPNDNDIVCQCDRCHALGNTKTNASPAVYTLLNKLAKDFPKQEFFSTAYITTQTPPPFKTASNAGVMISTMAFPKGIVLEQSDKKDLVDDTFSGWKKVTDKIYLWDYAVNFDNYFKAYPTVAITQKNLQYYKKLGVTGVFMQGSEDMYSAYADLKCYLYAQLMQDTDIDVKDYTRFFESKYPSVANLLTGYYTAIEERALASNKVLDIYGGMEQARKKYLDEKEFDDFYTALYLKSQTIDKKEFEALKPLLASLTFIKLELLRTNGIGTNGYATSAVQDKDAVINPQVRELLERLSAFSTATGIKVYNESGYTVADYLKYWRTEIVIKPYKNLLFGKKLSFINEPDDDYANIKMLTDGAVGFQDYYNNWLLSTANSLKVAVNTDDVKGAKAIEMSFLNDTRHKIYLPERVVVMIEGRKFEAKVSSAINNDSPSKYRVIVPIELLPEDKTITIEVIKQDNYRNRSTACDEIFFK